MEWLQCRWCRERGPQFAGDQVLFSNFHARDWAFTGGGTVGYNWQWGSSAFGIEPHAMACARASDDVWASKITTMDSVVTFLPIGKDLPVLRMREGVIQSADPLKDCSNV